MAIAYSQSFVSTLCFIGYLPEKKRVLLVRIPQIKGFNDVDHIFTEQLHPNAKLMKAILA